VVLLITEENWAVLPSRLCYLVITARFEIEGCSESLKQVLANLLT